MACDVAFLVPSEILVLDLAQCVGRHLLIDFLHGPITRWWVKGRSENSDEVEDFTPWMASCPQQINQCESNDFRGLEQIRQRQPLVGAVGVSLFDGAWASTEQHDRNPRRCIVAGVGI